MTLLVLEGVLPYRSPVPPTGSTFMTSEDDSFTRTVRMNNSELYSRKSADYSVCEKGDPLPARAPRRLSSLCAHYARSSTLEHMSDTDHIISSVAIKSEGNGFIIWDPR